jgi:hypothetical protein
LPNKKAQQKQQYKQGQQAEDGQNQEPLRDAESVIHGECLSWQ